MFRREFGLPGREPPSPLRDGDETMSETGKDEFPIPGNVTDNAGSPDSDESSPGTVGLAESAVGSRDDLSDALRDLDEATAEAQDEGFPIPGHVALANARRLLLAAYEISPRRFEAYPTSDGEIAIDASGGHGRGVLLLCDSGGGVLCLVTMNGRNRRARYPDAGPLPDDFIREALDELARRDEPVP